MDEKRTGYISIGEMAKMNRTTVPTLRLYDSMKLLTPCYVDEKTHYRYYDIKQNARLDMIQYMKELGIELKEIKSILDRKDLDLIEDVLMQKREQTLQEGWEEKQGFMMLGYPLRKIPKKVIRWHMKATALIWDMPG